MPAILGSSRLEYAQIEDPELPLRHRSEGLPSPDFEDRRKAFAWRHNDKVVLYTLLERLCAEEQGVCDGIQRSVDELNGNEDALDDFLNQQYYRLAYWKTSGCSWDIADFST